VSRPRQFSSREPGALRICSAPGFVLVAMVSRLPARIIHGGLLAETGLSPGEIAWQAATAAPKLAIEIARRWIGSRR
jgi:hypothetical protein